MFSDKTNVNQLTALMLSHGIRHVVVCPGSRNGSIVHNFAEAGTDAFSIYPVTDERSAAFVALGLSLATDAPAAVCVTSGSALLNTLPAVAEAYYRHISLLVVSADRPAQWVGQQDGQTLPQPGALQPYSATYNVPEARTAEEHWYNNCRINEALLALRHDGGRPVHVNLPIAEPLFSFSVPSLPAERIVREVRPCCCEPFSDDVLQLVRQARLPVLLMGQCAVSYCAETEALEAAGSLLVLPELIANVRGSWRTALLECGAADVCPDVVIHVGGNLVNKRFKLQLRNSKTCHVIRVASDNDFPDTFEHLHTVVRADLRMALRQLAAQLSLNPEVMAKKQELEHLHCRSACFVPGRFSDIGIMAKLAGRLSDHKIGALHLANSSVVRNAVCFFDGGLYPIHCNRGVNGIEGSLSAAVGYSLADDGLSLVLIGDLSFFYDRNALWNRLLKANLRILLFNNGGGQIFRRLPGLSDTPARDVYISGAHSVTAAGDAAAFGLHYIPVRNYAEWDAAAEVLLADRSDRPVLVEVFTAADDNEADRVLLNTYYQ